MPKRSRVWGAAAVPSLALAIVVGCGGSVQTSSPNEGSSPAPTTVTQPAVVDPSCQTPGVERDGLPAGKCLVGAECSFPTPSGLDACQKLHTPYAPVEPTDYKCTCETGVWACEIVGGGFGLFPCPDAGADDGG